MTVTAGELRREVLHPCMDALACNQQQERLLFNPSPEPDSLWELLKRIERHAKRLRDESLFADAVAALPMARQLIASNFAEGRRERRPVGWADQRITQLRDLELNGGPRSGNSEARESTGDQDAYALLES